jgi:hypothetical protein
METVRLICDELDPADREVLAELLPAEPPATARG